MKYMEPKVRDLSPGERENYMRAFLYRDLYELGEKHGENYVGKFKEIMNYQLFKRSLDYQLFKEIVDHDLFNGIVNYRIEELEDIVFDELDTIVRERMSFPMITSFHTPEHYFRRVQEYIRTLSKSEEDLLKAFPKIKTEKPDISFMSNEFRRAFTEDYVTRRGIMLAYIAVIKDQKVDYKNQISEEIQKKVGAELERGKARIEGEEEVGRKIKEVIMKESAELEKTETVIREAAELEKARVAEKKYEIPYEENARPETEEGTTEVEELKKRSTRFVKKAKKFVEDNPPVKEKVAREMADHEKLRNSLDDNPNLNW